MASTQRICLRLVAVAAACLFSIAAKASTNDREYRMGDNDPGPPTDGAAVSPTSGTFDSKGALGMDQLHDLLPTGAPVYRSYSGRPDGGSGLAVELNGSNQYLRSARLGLPDTTVSSVFSDTLNYTGITDRGLQFWVRPESTGVQSLVMDTNQHGARINADGNFSMRYNGQDFDSTESATAGAWRHVMVVRPNGDDHGSRMYVDGIAVAAAPGGYDGGDTSDLVVGSNTGGDDGISGTEGFTGGTEEFFDGLIDDLELFVIGESVASDTSPVEPGVDFGDFNFGVDNDFAAFTLSGVAGDIDNNGAFNADDRADFIAGWMNENVVNDIRVGDLNTFTEGDLNFDGVTDIGDLAIIQTLLPVAGLSSITAAELTGVPEPATMLLALMAGSMWPVGRRRRVS